MTRSPQRPKIHGGFFLFRLIIPLSLTCPLHAIPTESALAETRYRVYKSNRFGLPENALNPDAIIEFDERNGRGTIYESDAFGNADIFKGPKYVIEPEFLPLRELDSDIDEPCDDLADLQDDSHLFNKRRRR